MSILRVLMFSFFAFALTACGGGGGSDSSPSSASGSSSSSSSGGVIHIPIGEDTFANPLLVNGADPWLEYFEGNYYLLTTTWTSQLVMRKSPTLAGLSSAKPVYVWSDDRPSRCCNFWAFELHRLDGPNGLRWYINYTAGSNGTLDDQKIRVLESAGDNPLGPYSDKGTPLPARWNIDGTYLEEDGLLYMLWSEWSGPNQSIWIAEMSDPWTVVPATDAVIATPAASWEIIGSRVNEGAAAIQRNGKTFISFSASSCNTPDYKLGLLSLTTGADPLDPASWIKSTDPVFAPANGVYGPGHNGFFKSPDGTEDWLVYHGNNLPTEGCGSSRWTRAQPISFDVNDTPVFGEPAGPGASLAVPSGEMGPVTASVKGAAYHIVNRNENANNMCLSVAGNAVTDDANVSLRNCAETGSSWILDSTNDGYYRLVNSNSGKVLEVNCSTTDGTNAEQTAWVNTTCQTWAVIPTSDGWFRIANRDSSLVLEVSACGPEDSNIRQATWQNNACQQWRLHPAEQVAVTNVNSGKVLDVENCDANDGNNIRLWEYENTLCQKWTFQHTDNGYYTISPQHSPASCMIVENGSSTAGAGIIQGQCAGINSEFRLEPLHDGAVRLVMRDSAHVLDTADCLITWGTEQQIWDWLDNDCQKYSFLPVP
jgi:GH43 family beta-xylosidase